MKNILRTFAAYTSIIIAFVACSGSSTTKPEMNDEIKTDSSKTEAQANFICPMGKECGHSDVAGKCNSCGMELVASK